MPSITRGILGLMLGAYWVVRGHTRVGRVILRNISLYFHSIFSQTSLFGAQRHIDALAVLATFHASTCEVKSPKIKPSHDIMAIIVYNKAYTILRHNSCIQDLEQMSTHRAIDPRHGSQPRPMINAHVHPFLQSRSSSQPGSGSQAKNTGNSEKLLRPTPRAYHA